VGCEPTLLPSAVRKYEIQKPAFFVCWLILEQGMGTLRELQELDALIHVTLAGETVRFDVTSDPQLLGTPLSSFRVEEISINATIELVEIHGIDSFLDALVLTLKPHDGLIMEPLLISVAFR